MCVSTPSPLFSNPFYLGGLANVPPPKHFPHTARGELLAWLNDLLAPTIVTKLEQCGTGSVYCQIIDSIYGDLPMSRVKFNARMEYEYLDNFKILQKAFTRHKIEKVGCGFWAFLVGLADGVMLTNVISRYRWTGSSSVYKMFFWCPATKKRNVSDKALAWLTWLAVFFFRCKMQDNLEFLQWMKKYWDMHSRGEGYDAQARACVFCVSPRIDY